MRDLRSSHDHYFTLNNYKAEKFQQIHFDDEKKKSQYYDLFLKMDSESWRGRVLWKRYLHDFEILSIPFEWREIFIFSWVQFTEMGSRIFSRAPILTSSIIINGDGPVWDVVLSQTCSVFLKTLSF